MRENRDAGVLSVLLLLATALLSGCGGGNAAQGGPPPPPPPPGSGSPTLVQYRQDPMTPIIGGGSAALDHWKTPLPNPSPGGNLGVLACQWGASDTPTSVQDDKGNAWSTAKIVSDAATNASAGVSYFPNTTAGTRVITISWSSTRDFVSCFAYEFRNIATSSPVDGAPAGQKTTGTSLASGSVTSTSNGDLIYHFVGIPNGGNQSSPMSFTANSGFNLLGADGWSFQADEYQVQAAAGAVNPAITASVNIPEAISITVAFKSAGAGHALPAGIQVQGIRVLTVPENIFPAPANAAFQTPCWAGRMS